MPRNNSGDGRGSFELRMVVLSALFVGLGKDNSEKGICISGKKERGGGGVQCYRRTNIALRQSIG